MNDNKFAEFYSSFRQSDVIMRKINH